MEYEYFKEAWLPGEKVLYGFAQEMISIREEEGRCHGIGWRGENAIEFSRFLDSLVDRTLDRHLTNKLDELAMLMTGETENTFYLLGVRDAYQFMLEAISYKSKNEGITERTRNQVSQPSDS